MIVCGPHAATTTYAWRSRARRARSAAGPGRWAPGVRGRGGTGCASPSRFILPFSFHSACKIATSILQSVHLTTGQSRAWFHAPRSGARAAGPASRVRGPARRYGKAIRARAPVRTARAARGLAASPAQQKRKRRAARSSLLLCHTKRKHYRTRHTHAAHRSAAVHMCDPICRCSSHTRRRPHASPPSSPLVTTRGTASARGMAAGADDADAREPRPETEPPSVMRSNWMVNWSASSRM